MYKAVSFNIQSWNVTDLRKEGFVDKIKKLNPDLIGLQEVTYVWDELVNKTFSEDYYVFGDFRFSSYNQHNEKNTVLVRKSIFNVLKTETFWLSDTPHKESIAKDCMYPRVCTYVVLEEKKTKKQFMFLNTHLDHLCDEGRENETRCFVEFIKTLKLPIVLVGDFNSQSFHKSYKLVNELLKDSKMCFENPDLSWTWHTYDENPTEEIIDYIFISEEIEPLKFNVDKNQYKGVDVSDHRAIALEFCLK